MGYLSRVFFLLPGKRCAPHIKFFSKLVNTFTSKLGYVKANLVITNVSETGCLLADPSQTVTEKREFNIRSCIVVV
jgi:hypothetical protein